MHKDVAANSEEAIEDHGEEIVETKVGQNEGRAWNEDKARSKRLELSGLSTKEFVDMPCLGVPWGIVNPPSDTLAVVNVSYKATTAVFLPVKTKVATFLCASEGMHPLAKVTGSVCTAAIFVAS